MKKLITALALLGLTSTAAVAGGNCGLTNVQDYPGYASGNGWFDTGDFFFQATHDHDADTVTHTRVDKVTCEVRSVVIDVSRPATDDVAK